MAERSNGSPGSGIDYRRTASLLRATLESTHDGILVVVPLAHDARLNEGRVEQSGTPAEIREKPASAFVREFLAE